MCRVSIKGRIRRQRRRLKAIPLLLEDDLHQRLDGQEDAVGVLA